MGNKWKRSTLNTFVSFMLAALHYTSLQTAIILLSLFFRRENLLTVLFSAPLYIGIIKLVHRELPDRHRSAAVGCCTDTT